MYSVSVGIGGLVGSRPIWSYSFLSMLTRASRSLTIGIDVRLRRLTIRGSNSTTYKSRQSNWYSVKTTRSMMRRRTFAGNTRVFRRFCYRSAPLGQVNTQTLRAAEPLSRRGLDRGASWHFGLLCQHHQLVTWLNERTLSAARSKRCSSITCMLNCFGRAINPWAGSARYGTAKDDFKKMIQQLRDQKKGISTQLESLSADTWRRMKADVDATVARFERSCQDVTNKIESTQTKQRVEAASQEQSTTANTEAQ